MATDGINVEKEHINAELELYQSLVLTFLKFESGILMNGLWCTDIKMIARNIGFENVDSLLYPDIEETDAKAEDPGKAP